MNRLTGLLRKHGAIISLLGVLILLAGCGKGDGPQSEQLIPSGAVASRTVLVYMVGSDLETQNGAASMDLEEIRTAGVDTASTNVVVLTGGSLKWQSDISASANTTYRLNGERWEAIDRAEAANMGDAQTLSGFLSANFERFPAESYALILWDHGGGPIEGYGFDELYAFDHLTLPEMRQALQNSPFGQEKVKLKWVAMDACLMASIELASVFDDFADYLVASQEAVPNQGLNYAFLSDAGNELCDTEMAARRIADTYADYYEAQNAQLTNGKKTITMSCLDLSATDAVEQAVDRISVRLEETVKDGGYSVIAKGRSEARSFGRFTLGQDSDLIDLGVLAEQASQSAKAESEELLTALSRLVVYQRSNQEGTSGISIFFPYENQDYLSMDTDRQFGWQDIYEDLGFAPQYAAFLYRFSQTQTADPLADWAGSAAPQVEWDDADGKYYLQLTQEQVQNYDRAAFYILEHTRGEEYMLRFMSRDLTLDAQGRLYANYNNQAIYVINAATGELTTPLVFESERDDHTIRYQMPIFLSRVVDAESFQFEYQSGDLLAELNRETNEVTIIGAIPDEEDAAEKPRGKQEIRLEDWNTVRFSSYGAYMTRGDDNRLRPFGEWETSGSSYFMDFPVQDGFSIQMLPLSGQEGALYCIFTMLDTQGNRYSSALMPVTQTAPKEENPSEAVKELPIVTVSFPYAAEATRTILENDDLSLEMIGLRGAAYADEIEITMQARNKSSREIILSEKTTSVEGWNMKGSANLPVYLDPGETGTISWQICITHSELFSNLQDCGVDLVNEILTTVQYEVDGFGSTQVPVRIQTSFDPKPYYSTAYRLDQTSFPLDPQTLYHDNGVSVRLMDAYTTSSSSNLYLTFELDAEQSEVDSIEVGYVSFNGVMFDSVLYSAFQAESIHKNERLRFTMAFQLSDLALQGITTIQDIGFSLALRGNGGQWDTQTWHRLTPSSGGEADAAQTQIDSRLEGARVVWDRNGVCISQLRGLTAGTYTRDFYIENNTPFLISLSGRDMTVNGTENSDMFFYIDAIAPGKSAFVTLALTLSQVEEGSISEIERAGFRLLVTKPAENALLFVTDTIEVTF